MSWNYRMIKIEDYSYGIIEVYYEDSGAISSWSHDTVEPYGSDKDELVANLQMMLKATLLPSVEESEDGYELRVVDS